MMNILTNLGIWPAIILLSLIIQKLDQAWDHILVCIGMNFDPILNDIFFQEHQLRQSDHNMGVNGDMFGEQERNAKCMASDTVYNIFLEYHI